MYSAGSPERLRVAHFPTTLTLTPPTAFTIYLQKWFKEHAADHFSWHSGGVNLQGRTRWIVFNCTHCKENWHVSTDLFFAPGCMVIPNELKDWVSIHVQKHEYHLKKQKLEAEQAAWREEQKRKIRAEVEMEKVGEPIVLYKGRKFRD